MHFTTSDPIADLNEVSETIRHMIETAAAVRPDAPAIMTPGASAMTYRELADQAVTVRDDLAKLGLGAGHRIAIALPSDATLAVCFLTVASAATCAPLNVAYRAEEFGYLIKDLRADALIVDEAFNSAARDKVASLGLPMITIRRRTSAPAGAFAICYESDSASAEGSPLLVDSETPPGPDDIALLLSTSGTTAKPKIVPLSHRKLMASARNIINCYQLAENDVCLNVMPLFHIHGLVAGLLAPVWSGGATVCPPAFTADGFFAWLEAFSPTWYTAVPTMHQAVLGRAASYAKTIEANQLRFIRSSSAAISESVAAEIEDLFGAPLLEAYSMTEATHQMTSNPLPPGVRKVRSVGLPTGVELAILGEEGMEVEQGQIGEVAVRGQTVITAYERNPAANESSFVNGWFRTGDQGVLDADGYLTLTGRLKELIIRGGQNIAPVEVEEALLSHPAVDEAVCFAIPHHSLGEDVAAAIVLKDGCEVGQRELRRHVAEVLADFKVPRRVLFLEQIPKGPTGKLQRIGLAEKLGLDAAIKRDVMVEEQSSTELEKRIAKIWAAELGLEHIGLDEDYFDLGGDSLQAIEIFLKMEEVLGITLPPTTLFEANTVQELARRIEADIEAPCLVPIRLSDEAPALFCVHPVEGEAFGLFSIARHMKVKCSFYGLQSVGRDGKSPPLMRIEEMAVRYITEIRTVQPKGPYYLCGVSFGGLIVYEIAQRLQADGQKIAFLGLVDTYYPFKPKEVGLRERFADWLVTHRERYGQLPREKRHQYIVNILSNAYALLMDNLKRARRTFSSRVDPERVISVGPRIQYANEMASKMYRPRTYSGGATYFMAERKAAFPKIVHERWKDLIAGPLDIRPIPGLHFTVLDEPYVQALAKALDEALVAAREETDHRVGFRANQRSLT